MVHVLLSNHILHTLIGHNSISPSYQYALLLISLMRRQQNLIKGHIVNMDNCFNEVFPSFNPINPEFSPSNRIIDTYTKHFSFHFFNKHISHNIKSSVRELDKITLESSNDLSSTLVITDASIKNNVTMSIVHIHICDKPIMKTLHHATNITSIEAKLFAIKCSINQATANCDVSKIIVIMDSIHAVQKIFDSFSHPFQKHLVAILDNLQTFFSVICTSTCPEITSPQWSHLQNIQAHLSRNMPYGGAVTIWIFCLPWQRYSYSTQSSMIELPLSVSQHWNPKYLLYYLFVYKTSSYTVIH